MSAQTDREERPMMRAAFAVLVIACWVRSEAAFAQGSASQIVLITEQEARLPDAPAGNLTFRAGVTRGPKVLLITPATGGATASSPVHLQVKFESFGGARIDPASVSVRYLKDPTIDLTPRLQPAIEASGIDVRAAEIPAGSHQLRVDVKDSDGRTGTGIFELNVAH
jgi:hypothetical protein